MKGLLRVYDDSDTYKCKLNYAVVKENTLKLYEDKMNQEQCSFLNLSGCGVKKIFNEAYNINMIEITTVHNNVVLMAPDNMKDFDRWHALLDESSKIITDSYINQRQSTTPKKPRVISEMSLSPRESERRSNSNMRYPNQNVLHPSNNVDKAYPDAEHIVDHRKRNNNPGYVAQTSNDYRRNSAQVTQKRSSKISSANGPQRDSIDGPRRSSRGSATNQSPRRKRPSTSYNDRRESNLSNAIGPRGRRGIETVKEDPMMSDDEILETKPLKELRKKYPITDKTKRWSIAASELVGKSNDELFIMLIQLNREKSHMEIWKETLEKCIFEIDEKLKERISMQAVNELERNRTHYLEQLDNIEYMMNLAHPLISFMDSVVQMSDAYAGNNDAFHVVYHQCTPTGKEDFSNINFIRHNQEKQVAKLINEDKNQLSPFNSQKLNSLSRDTGSDKENEDAILLTLNNTEEFLDRRATLNDIIGEICSQFDELEPSKEDIRKFMDNMDNDYLLERNAASSIVNGKGSIKNVKTLKDNGSKLNNSAFMPRRSTRKAPKADMGPSINRKDVLKGQESLRSRSQNASLRYGQNYVIDDKTPMAANFNTSRRSFHSNTPPTRLDTLITPAKVLPVSATPRSQKSKSPSNNFADSIGRSTSSNVQNQFRDLMRTDPYAEKRPSSPIYRTPSSVMNSSEYQTGPLIKLNTGLFQNVHGPKRSVNSSSTKDFPIMRASISESDISVSSHIKNQRLNLNQQVDNNKSWKNPGRSAPSYEPNDNNLLNEESDAEQRAERLIQKILSTPEKMNIGDRYRASIVDESEKDERKTRQVRRMVTNESFSRLINDDAGQRNQRESQLLINARLAQEVSKKSRELQNL